MNDDRELVVNSIQCLTCQQIITSQNVHDFVTCGCRRVAVDGGDEYQRILSGGPYENLAVYRKSGPWEEVHRELSIKCRERFRKELEFLCDQVGDLIESGQVVVGESTDANL